MKQVFIVDSARTPIGDFLGGLSLVSNVDLGLAATSEVIKRSGIDKDLIEEVVCGMIYKAGSRGNPARQIQLAAGIPETGYATTIDQQCGSGMKAVEMISQQIMLGKTKIGLAIGAESMSNAAYIVENARTIRMGDKKLVDTLTHDGLVCAMCDYHMGITAENLAENYDIKREEQDEIALLSHQRARMAQKEGRFDDEIAPVLIKTKKGDVWFDEDEHPRDLDIDDLKKLKPVFKQNGTVTAGNSSGINDGAAALLLASKDAVDEYALKPKAILLSTASVGVRPEVMGIGPVFAIPKALEYAGLSMNDVDYFEINEAFAAQFLACNRELNISMDKVNANGSGIALGHPVGATGARIIVSLISEMQRRGSNIGVASLCVGGGPALASVIKLIG